MASRVRPTAARSTRPSPAPARSRAVLLRYPPSTANCTRAGRRKLVSAAGDLQFESDLLQRRLRRACQRHQDHWYSAELVWGYTVTGNADKGGTAMRLKRCLAAIGFGMLLALPAVAQTG